MEYCPLIPTCTQVLYIAINNILFTFCTNQHFTFFESVYKLLHSWFKDIWQKTTTNTVWSISQTLLFSERQLWIRQKYLKEHFHLTLLVYAIQTLSRLEDNTELVMMVSSSPGHCGGSSPLLFSLSNLMVCSCHPM